jgi:hypothetical protein
VPAFPSRLDLSQLAAFGFIIQGDAAGDILGYGSISSAGDVNGDGFDDIIVGGEGNDLGGGNAGAAWVIFGKAGGFTDIDLTTLTPAQGFRIQGDDPYDSAGHAVSSAGDVNGDGFDDILVGAQFAEVGGVGESNEGISYVIFGKAGGFTNIDLTTLTLAQGFSIEGDDGANLSGYSLASAGDINGDGFDDIIIGAYKNSDDGAYAGRAYVIFGKAAGFTNIELTSLTLAQGFIIQGDAGFDNLGGSVASAGDINKDGFDDLIVGAIGGDANGADAGTAYVIFGKASGFHQYRPQRP